MDFQPLSSFHCDFITKLLDFCNEISLRNDPELKYRVKLTGAELSVNLGRHLRHQKRGRQWQCSLDSDAPDPSHPWEWPPK